MTAPNMLNLSEFAQLRMIAWNRGAGGTIAEDEAFALYETNWRFIDQAGMGERERALLDRLMRQYGGGVLNV